MNEVLFFLHLTTIFIFTITALRMGKRTLGTWIGIQALLANLFVAKQIGLFGLSVTASDPFAVGAVLGLNFQQEFFGKEEAKKSVKLCFYILSAFTVLSQIHLLYTPAPEDDFHSAYVKLLLPTPRLFFASVLTFFFMQKLDLRLFCMVKTFFPLTSFGKRNFVCSCMSQLFDTILFTFLGLYGSIASPFSVIAVSFVTKAAAVIGFSVACRPARRFFFPTKVSL